MQITDQHSSEQLEKLGLRTNQMTVFHNPARFRVVVAGRRFGKTQLSLIEMMRAAQEQNRRVWYIGPSYDQAKRILWDRIKAITKPFWNGRPLETDSPFVCSAAAPSLSVAPIAPIPFAATVSILSSWTNSPPCSPSVDKVIRPALADRLGRALFIGTPQGSNHFYDLYKRAQTDPEWAAFNSPPPKAATSPPAELASAAADLDEESFRQEFEAVFTAAGPIASTTLSIPNSTCNRSASIPIMPLIWSIDFNVNPMCMLLMQRSDESSMSLTKSSSSPTPIPKLAARPFITAPAQYDTHQACRWKSMAMPAAINAVPPPADTDWPIIKKFFGQCPNLYNATFHW